jgi:tetratricopeptide (TPR) repeat protein
MRGLPEMPRAVVGQNMFDPRSLSLMCLARSYWLTGKLDQAMRYAETAIEDAERTAHPIAMFRAFALTMTLYFWIDALQQVEQNLAKLDLSSERNSAGPCRALALGLTGRYLLRTGHAAEGLRHLRDALKRLELHRYKLLLPEFAAELAVCLAKQNDRGEALALIDQVISGQREARIATHLPALFLTKALIFTFGDTPDRQSAEEYFKRSMALAREQSALSYELRAGLELAKIWILDGKSQRARDLIRPIYSRFSEGFGTRDLVLARQMLDMA